MKVRNMFLVTGIAGMLAFNAAGHAFADDADTKRALSSWRSEGKVFSLNRHQQFYSGLMKGTFFVKDSTQKTHYMHAVRMDCPFSVQINSKGDDEMQGACQLTDQTGNTTKAKISCSGPKENCQGKLTFISGTGNLKGIEGGGSMKIRVDLIQVASTEAASQSFGKDMQASGYLIISDLHDNVTADQDGAPVVR